MSDHKHSGPYFDVLLTVHYSNDQFWFQLMHHMVHELEPKLIIVVHVCEVAGQNTLHIKHVSHKSLTSMTHSLCSEANMYYCINIKDFT